MQTHCIPAKVPSLLFRPAFIFIFVIKFAVSGPSVVWHPDIVSSVHQLKRPRNRIKSITFFYKMLSITEFTMLHKHGVLSIIHGFSLIFACNSEHWQIPAIVRLDLVGLPSVPYLFHKWCKFIILLIYLLLWDRWLHPLGKIACRHIFFEI